MSTTTAGHSRLELIEGGKDPNPPKQLGSIIGETDEEFEERWLKSFAEAQAANPIHQAFSAAPEATPCQIHTGTSRIKDEWLTFHNSFMRPDPIVIYGDCPLCTESRAQAEHYPEWSRSGVPKEHLCSSFDNFDSPAQWQLKALESCREFADHESGFLLLLGTPGTGKDHLSIAIAKSHPEFLFVNHSRMLRALRETYSKRSSAKTMEQFEQTPLLVISDVGTSVGGNDDHTMLYDIIDYRASNKLKTIINSNLPQDQFKESLGDRITSRIKGALFRHLELYGKDFRDLVHQPIEV